MNLLKSKVRPSRRAAEPLYVQIESALRRFIDNGEYAPESRLPSEIVLAKSLGVSRFTVTKAIDALAKEGVVSRRQGSGTFVCPRREAPSSAAKSRSIGVVIYEMSHLGMPVMVDVLAGIGEAATAAGFNTHLFTVRDGGDAGDRETPLLLNTILPGQVAGLVIANQEIGDEQIRTLSNRVPTVVTNRIIPETVSVFADFVQAGYESARHLLGLGHKRIGIVGGPAEQQASHDVTKGYRLALLQAGIPYDDGLVVYGDYGAGSGLARARELLNRRPETTAIYAGDHTIGEGVWMAAREAGLSVPADLSLVVTNDYPFREPPPFGVTVVRVPFRELGVRACEMLIRSLSGRTAEAREVPLPVQLVVRDSTAAPASGRGGPAVSGLPEPTAASGVGGALPVAPAER